MIPVHDEKGVTIYWSHSVFVLMGMPSNSVDSIVTDPPYGLSFMGKKWDYDVPSIQLWRETLRILKPGGHLLAFGGSRTYHRMTVNIEDAGFEIRDQIMWLYGSGFPKSLDVSKAIDKVMPRVGKFVDFASHYENMRIKKGLTHTLICEKGKFFLNTNHGGASVNWSKGYNVPTMEQWHILKEILDLSEEWLPLIERIEAEREVIGQRQTGDPVAWYSETDRGDGTVDITTPATPEAKQWDGWGTALKPAHEPICVARKPLTGTVAENVLEHGTGGLNIDACRIDNSDADLTVKQKNFNSMGYRGANETNGIQTHNNKGRWPANLILDEEAGAMLDRQSGDCPTGDLTGQPRTENKIYSSAATTLGTPRYHQGDSGGASRFFYCAKASKADRDEGLEDFKLHKKKMGTFQDSRPHCSEDYKYEGLSRNPHPTVKPTDLMQYLVRLVTPPGGTVLDPFMGSGSTGKACVRENFKFIGIERDKDYIPIAIARIKAPAQVELL